MDRRISAAQAATMLAAMNDAGGVTRHVGELTGDTWYSQGTEHAMVQICISAKTGAATLHVCNYKLVRAGASFYI